MAYNSLMKQGVKLLLYVTLTLGLVIMTIGIYLGVLGTIDFITAPEWVWMH